MDGDAREVLHDTELTWPNGIAIDYPVQRIYWADAFLDKIEYSNVDGSGRTVLETAANGVVHPFALTLEGDLLFWTEWANLSIFATHKINGIDVEVVVGNLPLAPNGIEAVTPDRQAYG